jgi:hypothetical protein
MLIRGTSYLITFYTWILLAVDLRYKRICVFLTNFICTLGSRAQLTSEGQ